jgi:transposase
MVERKRRKYSTEFKEEAVKLVSEQRYSVSEAARNLGIHPTLLSRWKRDIEKSEEGPSASGSRAELEVEVRRLRQENKRLQMEREILKKAAAFFAKESN